MSKSVRERRKMVRPGDTSLSISKQCGLLQIHRSGLYYKPKGESGLNIELMGLLDKKHLETPCYGVPRLWQWLRRDRGYKISKSRVERLCGLMGLSAIYPKPNTSKPRRENKVFPYLLKNLKIERINQVWEADITYVPMQKGFMYLMAIIDVRSRFIVNWSLSNTMDAAWCCQVVDEAIARHGKPEILNTDQGSQFTSDEFTELVVNQHKIRLSMDGKGRALDNIYIERFWRSIKYEHIYLSPSEDGIELYKGIKNYIEWYNQERRHQSLNYRVPNDLYSNNAGIPHDEIAA